VSLIQLLIEGALLLRSDDFQEFNDLVWFVGEMVVSCKHGGQWQYDQSLTTASGLPDLPTQQCEFEYMGLLRQEAHQLLLPVLQQLSPLVLYALQRAPAAREQYAQEKRQYTMDGWQETAKQALDQHRRVQTYLEMQWARLVVWVTCAGASTRPLMFMGNLAEVLQPPLTSQALIAYYLHLQRSG
jgi:hypothetical protein